MSYYEPVYIFAQVFFILVRLLKNCFVGLECTFDGCDDRITILLTEDQIADKVKLYVSEMSHLHLSAFRLKSFLNGKWKTDYVGLQAYENNV